MNLFAGMPEGALDFLRRLKRNNRREWFLPRKAEYEALLLEPMRALVHELDAELLDAGLPLRANTRQPISRVYRDVRFSADKSPYQSFISAVFARGGDKKSPGVLYVHVDPAGSFAAVGFWQPERDLLARWRSAIVEDPERWTSLVRSLGRQAKFSEEGMLKRMPRGFEPYAEEAFAAWLRRASFVVSQPLTEAQVRSAKLPSLLVKYAVRCLPLLEFGWKLEPRRTAVFRSYE